MTPNIADDIPSYTIINDPNPENGIWTQFADAVRHEGFRDNDNALLLLIPNMSSSRGVFAVSETGEFLGTVQWHESKVMAWIGFFFVRNDIRGKGLGKELWKRALTRIPQNLVFALRSVTRMIEFYKKTATPITADVYTKYKIPIFVLQEFCSKNAGSNNTEVVKLTKALSNNEFKKFASYDQSVTGVDRSAILRKYFALDCAVGSVLLDNSGNVIAQATVSETGFFGGDEFKITSLFCDDIHQAATLMAELLEFCTQNHKSPTVMLNVQKDTRGEELIRAMQEMFHESVVGNQSFPTLVSRDYIIPFDESKAWLKPNIHFLADA